MYKRIVLFFMFLGFAFGAFAQETDTTKVEEPAEVPVISYSLAAKKYKIADIKITGIKNYDDFVLIGFSGLSVGDEITVPGEEITTAVKRFWKHGLFSDVKILATKIEGDQIWLEIQLKQRPRISQVNYHGIKKGEREDLEAKLGLKKGFQVTPNVMDRAKIVIQKFFDGKGFKNVDVEIEQKDDPANEGEVIVDINIDKNEKTKIHRIYFEGNEKLTARELKKAMKKTNEKFSLPNDWKTSIMEMFSTKKFTTEEYENDKKNIIAKYNEHGYRDAVLLSDSVANFNEKKVDIFLKVDEGEKYYLKDIRFVGNTQYSTDYLMAVLGMKPGEVYNQKKLNERLSTDEDAVSNVYFNNGYLFFNADPVEVDVANDSISLEIRIQEGPQATINRIIINGNDRLYEDIVRRELRTKPGMLFSREDLMRSVRELAQMGHFDPENIKYISGALLRGDTVGLRSAFPVDGLLPAHIDTKTAAESGFAINEKRYVGAENSGEALLVPDGHFCFIDDVKCIYDRRGIGTAAAESSADRYPLDDLHMRAAGYTGFIEKQLCRFIGDISPVCRHISGCTVYRYTAVTCKNRDRVMKRYGLHDRFDIMIAVRTSGSYMQCKIYLRVRFNPFAGH